MFRTFTCLVVSAVVLVTAAVLAWGWNAVVPVVLDGWRDVQSTIADGNPEVHAPVGWKVRSVLKKLSQELDQKIEALAETERRQETCARQAQESDQEFAKQRDRLYQIKQLLDEDGDRLQFHDRSYTREELTAHAVTLEDSCQQLAEEAKLARQLADRLAESVKESQQALLGVEAQLQRTVEGLRKPYLEPQMELARESVASKDASETAVDLSKETSRVKPAVYDE